VSVSDGDVEVRQNSVVSLGRLMRREETLFGRDSATCADVCRALRICLSDYFVDRRGDVGSWVRESSLDAFEQMYVDGAVGVSATDAPLLLSALAQQCFDKIDRVRTRACRLVERLFVKKVDAPSPFLAFPSASGLREWFCKEKESRGGNIEWSSESLPFSLLLPRLLDVPELRQQTVCGVAISVGSRTDHLIRAVVDSLKLFFERASVAQVREFGSAVVAGWRDCGSDERLSQSFLKLCELSLSHEWLVALSTARDPLPLDLLDLIRAESSGTTDVQKLIDCANA
jgi:hypothetical protein